MMRYLAGLLILYGFFYLGAGPFVWKLALLRHDYPGPLELRSVSAREGLEIDWLLVHGANQDARVYQKILKNSRLRLVAVSLSHHEEGPHRADPSLRPAEEICSFLSRTPVRRGVVGHSMAGLWIAQAYKVCPSKWEGLQVILLAPHLGEARGVWTAHLIPLLKRILPDPCWGFMPIRACFGVGKEHYSQCKQDYLYGRRRRFVSAPYYEKLVAFAARPETEEAVAEFLRDKERDVVIVLAEQDLLISNRKAEEFAQRYSIRLAKLPQTSHFGVLSHYDKWLPNN